MIFDFFNIFINSVREEEIEILISKKIELLRVTFALASAFAITHVEEFTRHPSEHKYIQSLVSVSGLKECI